MDSISVNPCSCVCAIARISHTGSDLCWGQFGFKLLHVGTAFAGASKRPSSSFPRISLIPSGVLTAIPFEFSRRMLANVGDSSIFMLGLNSPSQTPASSM